MKGVFSDPVLEIKFMGGASTLSFPTLDEPRACFQLYSGLLRDPAGPSRFLCSALLAAQSFFWMLAGDFIAAASDREQHHHQDLRLPATNTSWMLDHVIEHT